ncbi:MAG: hypothetical protein LAO51_16925 [Acidobacteriia bacterium]|nr:hypothetical protein [Terriglobia bacterium]
MSYYLEQPGSVVAVDGAFDDQGFWCIHGRLWCRTMFSAEARKRAGAEMELELLRGIAREARRGRSLGARSFRLFVEDEADLVGSFEILSADEAHLRGPLPPRSARLTGN